MLESMVTPERSRTKVPPFGKFDEVKASVIYAEMIGASRWPTVGQVTRA